MDSINDPQDPRLLKIHAERLARRDMDQLLGICEFALQDSHVDQDEAEAIHTWLRAHGAILDTWPANVLYDRLTAMLADGVLDQDEQRELLDIVMQIARPRQEDGTRAASTLPLNDPAPPIEFVGRRFCFTGVFDFGSRAQCHAAVVERGGEPAESVTTKLHYLVIGSIGSEVWQHGSFGAKIARAIAYREKGRAVAVVSEEQWRASL